MSKLWTHIQMRVIVWLNKVMGNVKFGASNSSSVGWGGGEGGGSGWGAAS